MTGIADAHVPGVLTLRAPTAPLVPLAFDSPHSGRVYPEEFQTSAPLADLRQAEDMFVDDLYDSAPAKGAPLLMAHFPRLYIDPNRAETDLDPASLAGAWPGPPLAPGPKAVLGQGLIWMRRPPGVPVYGAPLPAAEAFRRIETYHRPYHRALMGMVGALYDRFGGYWHVNCHSMPAVAGGMSADPPGSRRPDFVLGSRGGDTCGPDLMDLVHGFLTARGFEVWVNELYKGVEIVRACGDPAAGRHSLQIEVNRRLYMDEERLEKSAAFAPLKAVIGDLIALLAGRAADAIPK